MSLAKELGKEAAYPSPPIFGDNGYGLKIVEESAVPGMTKREAFAMSFMAGLLANPGHIEHGGLIHHAERAVQAADALLAELAKEQA